MLDTDNYIRYTHVDAVTETATGVEAELHRERLRIDVVREDVVRLKISRGGEFDENPTYAVCVDPLADVPDFTVARDEERVQVRTAACTVSLWLDPFRIDVHRADGTPVVETAADEEGRYWAYATLNDAFTRAAGAARRTRSSGWARRPGGTTARAATSRCGTPTCSARTRRREFTEGKAPDDPRGDRRSAEFDPFYVSIPFFYHQDYPAGLMAGSFLDNGYRGSYEFSPSEEYRIHFRGGQYTEYVFAGPAMPAILDRLHLADRPDRAAAAVVARLPPVPLVRLHPGRGRADRRRAPRRTTSPATRCGWTSTTWTATGCSPGTPSASPTRRRCWPGWPSRASG